MPKALEKKLRMKGRAKGYTARQLDSYIFGTMRRLGWKPKKERYGNRVAKP